MVISSAAAVYVMNEEERSGGCMETLLLLILLLRTKRVCAFRKDCALVNIEWLVSAKEVHLYSESLFRKECCPNFITSIGQAPGAPESYLTSCKDR